MRGPPVVLKNRSNKIRSNEIRIRRELPVHEGQEQTFPPVDLY